VSHLPVILGAALLNSVFCDAGDRLATETRLRAEVSFMGRAAAEGTTAVDEQFGKAAEATAAMKEHRLHCFKCGVAPQLASTGFASTTRVGGGNADLSYMMA
jgi:hypothetical protein